MSAKVSGFILDHYPHGGAEKLVALALADEANADGDHIFPGVARLAERCCMSERGVQKILRRIEGRDINGVFWFERVKFGGGGRRMTNQYRCPIAHLEDEVRKTANNVRGNDNETPNSVQGNNPEHCSGFPEKPRTQRSKTPNGGSPDPLYPPNQTIPAHEKTVPTTVGEWGTHLAQTYGYSLSSVMTSATIAMFRDWLARGLSTELVDDAITAAHTKNGGLPGSPAFYRNFVNQMAASEQAAAQERAAEHMAASRTGARYGENHSGRDGQHSSRSIHAWAEAAREF